MKNIIKSIARRRRKSLDSTTSLTLNLYYRMKRARDERVRDDLHGIDTDAIANWYAQSNPNDITEYDDPTTIPIDTVTVPAIKLPKSEVS